MIAAKNAKVLITSYFEQNYFKLGSLMIMATDSYIYIWDKNIGDGIGEIMSYINDAIRESYRDKIDKEIAASYNGFIENNGFTPKTLFMGSEDYLRLYLRTYSTWARQLDKPHVLEKYCGCEIKIAYMGGVRFE